MAMGFEIVFQKASRVFAWQLSDETGEGDVEGSRQRSQGIRPILFLAVGLS
jgi:hypothetical protein